jgi:hypothetical protein
MTRSASAACPVAIRCSGCVAGLPEAHEPSWLHVGSTLGGNCSRASRRVSHVWSQGLGSSVRAHRACAVAAQRRTRRTSLLCCPYGRLCRRNTNGVPTRSMGGGKRAFGAVRVPLTRYTKLKSRPWYSNPSMDKRSKSAGGGGTLRLIQQRFRTHRDLGHWQPSVHPLMTPSRS